MLIKRFFMLAIALMLSAFSSQVLADYALAGTTTVDNGVAYYWVLGKKTIKQAEKEVMANCKNNPKANEHTGPCRILMNGKFQEYIAVFFTENGDSLGVGASKDRQRAIDMAYEACAKHGKCPNEARRVLFDDGPGGVVQQVAQNKQCQPPAGKVLRYHDQCFNGACTRTFENGCTKQFQAPYCFDPVQQKWDWKPDGC